MSISLHWQNLRPWNGSQQSAFEALCCQFAEYEIVPQGSKFVRKAAPDAGLECFWKFSNGDEWGWQAKFFTSVPGSSQWSQIKDSIDTAIEKHPNLKIYTICLPIDRQDPRDGKDWFLNVWNEKVKEWEESAKSKGRLIEFQYWGEHELLDRLSKDEHKGRLKFWFDRNFLDAKWFKDRIDEVISNVGPRYSPEINVDLPISNFFEALGRTKQYFNHLKKISGQINRAFQRTQNRKMVEAGVAENNLLKESIRKLLIELLSLPQDDVSPIKFDRLRELISEAVNIAWNCYEHLGKATASSERTPNGLSPADDLRYHKDSFFRLWRALDDFNDELSHADHTLPNIPSLLIVGEAGTGKTHLLCDIASRRITDNKPTIIYRTPSDGGTLVSRWSNVSLWDGVQ